MTFLKLKISNKNKITINFVVHSSFFKLIFMVIFLPVSILKQKMFLSRKIPYKTTIMLLSKYIIKPSQTQKNSPYKNTVLRIIFNSILV